MIGLKHFQKLTRKAEEVKRFYRKLQETKNPPTITGCGFAVTSEKYCESVIRKIWKLISTGRWWKDQWFVSGRKL
jgi:tRNA U38,U39,U40 pseudouridine synthase TruA